MDNRIRDEPQLGQRPTDQHVQLLAKLHLTLSESHAAMTEEELYYELPLHGSILLGPCRAANLVARSPDILKPINVDGEQQPQGQGQGLSQWGMPHQTRGSVPDLTVFFRPTTQSPSSNGDSGGELKNPRSLNNDEMRKAVEHAKLGAVQPGQKPGIVVKHGAKHPTFVTPTGAKVSVEAQRIFSQVSRFTIMPRDAGSPLTRLPRFSFLPSHVKSHT